MNIYLVRHALPDYATGVPYHTPPGPALTALGLEQAAATARMLSRSKIERVVSSPMQRCLMTAEPISAGLRLDLQVDPDLGEHQPGETPMAVALRMMRAVLAQSDAPTVAFVSHSGPLEQLLLALTHNKLTLPAPDARGCRIAVANVWHVQRRHGLWEARHLPVDEARTTEQPVYAAP